jgi:ribonuclease HI
VTPEVVIWTDGSCPKPDGPGGWAAILQRRSADGEVLAEREITGGSSRTTNNRAELMAVIVGLEALKRPCRVRIVIDSQYVMHGFTRGWVQQWKRNGWRTKGEANLLTHAGDPTNVVKNRDLWERLDALVAEHQVEWHHVKGHLKPSHADWTEWHANNIRCDELAGAETKRIKEALTLVEAQAVC